VGFLFLGVLGMVLFLSTVTNRVDKKGRVSVPAGFRTKLSEAGHQSIVCYESLGDHPCIDGCSLERMAQLAESFDEMDPFNEERNAFAAHILGGAKELPIDGDGRIVLPGEFMEFAGIEGEAAFVGLGQTFQIWSPDQFASYRAGARKLARASRGNIPWSGRGQGGGQ
tara:strand:- start:794 stop:1297 length:504 start_codon:yes stop_codon:yes gene_type:complete